MSAEKEYISKEKEILQKRENGNYKEVLKFFEEYASKGIASAQFYLGHMYYLGDGVKIKQAGTRNGARTPQIKPRRPAT